MPGLGKGTWMTNLTKNKYKNIDVVKKSRQLLENLEGGLTYIDTAERYASGFIEKMIGTMTKRSDRDNLFLVSKVSSNHLGFDDVISSARASIKRLQSKYLDLYLLHEYNPNISLKGTIRALDNLIEQKLVKNIGVCNFSIEQLKEAQSYTKNRIVANQLRYSLMNRDMRIKEIVKYCHENDIMVIAWRPYDHKSLTKNTGELLGKLSKKYKSTPAKIVFFWLSSQINTVVLDNFEKPEDLRSACEAFNLNISQPDIDRLNLVN